MTSGGNDIIQCGVRSHYTHSHTCLKVTYIVKVCCDLELLQKGSVVQKNSHDAALWLYSITV